MLGTRVKKSPKRDCGSKRVKPLNHPFQPVTGEPLLLLKPGTRPQHSKEYPRCTLKPYVRLKKCRYLYRYVGHVVSAL